MNKGEKAEAFSMAEEDITGEQKAISIMKTMDIYCGKPTAGYQVVRGGLDVVFTPDLDKVYSLIDEYYNGQEVGSHRAEED